MGESSEKVEADARKLESQGVDAAVLTPSGLARLFPALNDCGEPFDLTGETEHECEDVVDGHRASNWIAELSPTRLPGTPPRTLPLAESGCQSYA